MLELAAGLLKLLPIANNPIERDWYVMHLSAQQIPLVAVAFEQFLCTRGQARINAELEQHPPLAVSRASAKRGAHRCSMDTGRRKGFVRHQTRETQPHGFRARVPA